MIELEGDIYTELFQNGVPKPIKISLVRKPKKRLDKDNIIKGKIIEEGASYTSSMWLL